ncbi:MAG TPA: hypothetical protein VIV14_05170 [Gammaproteobacteria bacterium]
MNTIRTPALAAFILALTLLIAAFGVVADEVSDFYSGKQVRLLIGYSAGGGYDTYARLLSRHLGKHIPGNPTVVPQNMPGAGSLRMANYLYNVAPKDGTVIGTFGRGIAMEPLLSGQGTQFDAREFSWLGSLNNEVSLCVAWHGSSIKRMEDLQTQELIVGGTGSGSDTVIFPVVLKNLLGANIRLISGYPGGNDVLLAMERGEIDGRCGWSYSSLSSTRGDWLERGQITILSQLALAKHPDLTEYPIITEFADSENELAAMEIIFSRQVMGRPYLAPPGIPGERLEALRRALDAVALDPEFLADAAQLQLEVNPVTGEDVEALLDRIYGATDAAIELASSAIRAAGGAE